MQAIQSLETLSLETLNSVSGGAGQANQNQAELRDMARRWCPQTYARNASAPTLTRRMGEQCLDEAGFGAYKSQLDKYFPANR